jgi:hypothetical protein
MLAQNDDFQIFVPVRNPQDREYVEENVSICISDQETIGTSHVSRSVELNLSNEV